MHACEKTHTSNVQGRLFKKKRMIFFPAFWGIYLGDKVIYNLSLLHYFYIFYMEYYYYINIKTMKIILDIKDVG